MMYETTCAADPVVPPGLCSHAHESGDRPLPKLQSTELERREPSPPALWSMHAHDMFAFRHGKVIVHIEKT